MKLQVWLLVVHVGWLSLLVAMKVDATELWLLQVYKNKQSVSVVLLNMPTSNHALIRLLHCCASHLNTLLW